MIYLSRIVGESLDLQTGQELPPSIVLSNGDQDITLYVGEQEMRQIVAMYVGTTQVQPVARQQVEEPEPVAAPVKKKETKSKVRGTNYQDPETGTESI